MGDAFGTVGVDDGDPSRLLPQAIGIFFGYLKTYHLSVLLTDLYFNRVLNIPKADLQLVGTAAMYVAAKLEEQVAVEVNRFAASTEWKYPAPLILEMEAKITKVFTPVNIGFALANEPTDDKHVGQ